MIASPEDRLAIILADREGLHKALQPLHVLVTGVPDPGTPPKQTTPLRLFAEDIGWLGAGMALAGTGAALLSTGALGALLGAPITAIGALAATGRLRRIVVGHVHEASHGLVSRFYRRRGKSKRWSRRLGEAVLDLGTALTFTQNGQDYRRLHSRHHDPARLGTLGDPDGALLQAWGIWPDQPGSFARQLLLAAINPLWHARFFAARMRSNVLRGKPYRRLLGALSLAALASSALVLPWPVWFAAVFLPFGPGYHWASLAQLTTIHPYGFSEPAADLDAHAARTWERIPYRPMPGPGAPMRAWLAWGAAMIGHAAARLAVLDDTMVAHGWHHLAWPLGRPFVDWWNTAQYWVDAYGAGALPEGAAGRILWGLPEAWSRQAAQFRHMRD